MRKADEISQRQLLSMLFAGLLSPMIRFLPGTPVSSAGAAAWLSPVFAVLPSVLYVLFISEFLKNRLPGEGMGRMFERSIGRAAGKICALVFGIWVILYAGHALRSSAERLVSSVYEYGNIGFFLVVIMGVSLVTAFGSVRTLARTAEVFTPIIVFVLAFVLIFSFINVKWSNLTPVTPRMAGDISLGGLQVVNFISMTAYFTFLAGHVKKTRCEWKCASKWILLLLAAAFLVQIAVIGTLSVGVLEGMQHPFFIMIRNLRFFGAVERLESLVVAIWVGTDFIFLSSLIMIAAEIVRGVIGTEKRFPLIGVIAAAVFFCASVMYGNSFELYAVGRKIIPIVNAILTFAVVPIVFLIGRLRKKI